VLDLLSELVADQRHDLPRVANTGVCRFRCRPCAPAITAFSMALCSPPSMLFAFASTARSARPSGIDGGLRAARVRLLRDGRSTLPYALRSSVNHARLLVTYPQDALVMVRELAVGEGCGKRPRTSCQNRFIVVIQMLPEYSNRSDTNNPLTTADPKPVDPHWRFALWK
jgi:hypothetical protein